MKWAMSFSETRTGVNSSDGAIAHVKATGSGSRGRKESSQALQGLFNRNLDPKTPRNGSRSVRRA
jgi:hypothetical protein